MPRPSRCAAQKSPSAPRFAIQPRAARIRAVSVAHAAARRARAAPASRRAIRCGVRVSSTAAIRRASARTSGRRSRRSPPALAPPSNSRDPLLQRVGSGAGTPRSGQPCARQAASIPACLPEQLWPSFPSGRPSCRPFSRSSTVAPARASSRPDGGELRRLRLVRRTGDRDLVVVEVVVALDERHGLDRLRRGAEEARRRSGRPQPTPSRGAAWTRWTASTTSPRRTSTLSASTAGGRRCRSFPRSRRGGASSTAP